MRRLRQAVPVFVICGLVNILMLVTLRSIYEKKSDGAFLNLLITLENSALDARFLLRGKQKPTGKIGVLAIDEKSIQKFGRWPFPRRIFEKAFINLKKAGVEWIGFDVVWDQPERALL